MPKSGKIFHFVFSFNFYDLNIKLHYVMLNIEHVSPDADSWAKLETPESSSGSSSSDDSDSGDSSEDDDGEDKKSEQSSNPPTPPSMVLKRKIEKTGNYTRHYFHHKF
jgi:hypothetical protein